MELEPRGIIVWRTFSALCQGRTTEEEEEEVEGVRTEWEVTWTRKPAGCGESAALLFIPKLFNGAARGGRAARMLGFFYRLFLCVLMIGIPSL